LNFVDPARMQALVGEVERLLREAGSSVKDLVNTHECGARPAATQTETPA
jgi:hypothetical protein